MESIGLLKSENLALSIFNLGRVRFIDFWSDLIGPSVRPWDSDGVPRTPAIGDARDRRGWTAVPMDFIGTWAGPSPRLREARRRARGSAGLLTLSPRPLGGEGVPLSRCTSSGGGRVRGPPGCSPLALAPFGERVDRRPDALHRDVGRAFARRTVMDAQGAHPATARLPPCGPEPSGGGPSPRLREARRRARGSAGLLTLSPRPLGGEGVPLSRCTSSGGGRVRGSAGLAP
jgi:hypothetical protein